MTFVKCLGEMAVECEGTVHDFLSYTREWIARVNRGGLFPLNDMTYNIIFFVSVEKEVRALLPTHMTKETDKEAFQEVVLNRLVEIDEVQFTWTLVSQCSVSEEDAIELLRDKVSLWVTSSSCLPFPLPILLGILPHPTSQATILPSPILPHCTTAYLVLRIQPHPSLPAYPYLPHRTTVYLG